MPDHPADPMVVADAIDPRVKPMPYRESKGAVAGRWFEVAEADLIAAADLLRAIPAIIKTRDEVVASCSRVNTELRQLEDSITAMVKP